MYPKSRRMEKIRDIVTLYDLLILELKSLHEGESHWASELERMSNHATELELAALFIRDSQSALRHAGKLRVLLESLGSSGNGHRNAVIGGIEHELNELIAKSSDHEILNAGMILIQQCVNHYNIAKYGTLAAYCRLLQREDIAEELHLMLLEEKEQDGLLSRLAEEKINKQAKSSLIL